MCIGGKINSGSSTHHPHPGATQEEGVNVEDVAEVADSADLEPEGVVALQYQQGFAQVQQYGVPAYSMPRPQHMQENLVPPSIQQPQFQQQYQTTQYQLKLQATSAFQFMCNRG